MTTGSRSILGRLPRFLGPAPQVVELAPGERARLSTQPIAVPVAGGALDIDWPGARLRLETDSRLVEPEPAAAPALVLRDRDRVAAGIHDFVWLVAGDRFDLRAEDTRRSSLLADPDAASRIRLHVEHVGEHVVLREVAGDREVDVARVSVDEGAAEPLSVRRRALTGIRELYGGPIEPLPAAPALELLDSVIDGLASCFEEGSESDGPAAIVRLDAESTPIIVGDVHGRVDNLLSVLTRNAFLEGLEQGVADLVLLGDVVHPDGGDDLRDMRGSMLAIDLVLTLMHRFPGRVHHLLGNHDSFSSDVLKGGVAQGVVWEKALIETRGERYRDAMAEFYRRLPLVAIADDFCACHAGPPLSTPAPGAPAVEWRRPELVHELTWTRQQGPGYPQGYAAADVRRFRRALGLPKDAAVIVGHNPRSAGETLWMNAGRITGHHVVFSARADQIGVMTRVAGDLVPQIYPVEPLSLLDPG